METQQGEPKMKRRTNRTAFLVPEDTPGSFGVLVAGVLIATGLDRFTAQAWAVARGYRVRVLRDAATQDRIDHRGTSAEYAERFKVQP